MINITFGSLSDTCTLYLVGLQMTYAFAVGSSTLLLKLIKYSVTVVQQVDTMTVYMSFLALVQCF